MGTRPKRHNPAPKPFDGYHQKSKKHLQSPLNHVFEGATTELVMTQWRDDGYPEFLWLALLLVKGVETTRYEKVRRIATKLPKFDADNPQSSSAGSHTSLSLMHHSTRRSVIAAICNEIADPALLRPLGLLPNLPAAADWQKALPSPVPDQDWEVIAEIIERCTSTQDVEATDICWARSLFGVTTGASSEFEGSDLGRMRDEYPANREEVGGFFRCGVGPNPLLPRTAWTDQFWRDLWLMFPSEPSHPDVRYSLEIIDIRLRTILPLYLTFLSDHYWSIHKGDRDSKRDVVFGLLFQAAFLAQETLSDKLDHSFAGLAALRSIVECTINLCYLAKKDDQELWTRFQNYGYGKARLLKKKVENASRPPVCIDKEWLDAMCGDSPAWYFTDINLGDWTGENIRERSVVGDTKEIYDAYYDYTSSLLHCDWLSIRAIGLTFDANPLHRLQQVPRLIPRRFPTVIFDFLRVLDVQIEALNNLYPGFDFQLSRMVYSSATTAVGKSSDE